MFTTNFVGVQAELAAIKLQIAEAVEAEEYDTAQALKTKMAGVELAAIKLQIAEAVEAEEYETAQELKEKMAALQAKTHSSTAAAPVVKYMPPSSSAAVAALTPDLPRTWGRNVIPPAQRVAGSEPGAEQTQTARARTRTSTDGAGSMMMRSMRARQKTGTQVATATMTSRVCVPLLTSPIPRPQRWHAPPCQGSRVARVLRVAGVGDACAHAVED